MGSLFWIAVIFKAGLGASMFVRRMARDYKWFTIFVLASVGPELTLLWIPHRSLLYTYTWMSVEPVMWVLRIAVVVEAYHRFSSIYPAFARENCNMFFSTLATAAILSLVLLPVEIPRVPAHQAIVTSYSLMVVAKRFVTLMCALFVGMTITFALRNALPVSRNLASHGILLGLYFAFDAGTCFLGITKGTLWGNRYVLPASFVLMLLWPFAYKRGADRAAPVILTKEEERLLEEGPAIQSAIARLAWYFTRRMVR
jgi:hypothetical protein